MPSVGAMQETAKEMLEKYKLPNFAYAVAGMHVLFMEQPQGVWNIQDLRCFEKHCPFFEYKNHVQFVLFVVCIVFIGIFT